MIYEISNESLFTCSTHEYHELILVIGGGGGGGGHHSDHYYKTIPIRLIYTTYTTIANKQTNKHNLSYKIITYKKKEKSEIEREYP